MTCFRSKVLTVLVVGSVLSVACGGNVSGVGTGTGGSAGMTGTGGLGGFGGVAGSAPSGGAAGFAGGPTGDACGASAPCTHPPPRSSAQPNTGGTPTVIAVSKLYLGYMDANGNPDPNAWKSIGYDLDGLISTPTSMNHCKPVPGANPANVKRDGNSGIDNSFGENLLPLLTSLTQNLPLSVNQSIASGTFTEIFKFDNLTTATNQNGVTAANYAGANKGSPAAFNGTDVWPVAYESVNNGNINDPKLKFPNSYVSGGMWVSGSKGYITIPLSFQGYILRLPISGAVVTMQVKGTGTSATAVNGTIAGVINTDALINALKPVAGAFDPSLCDGPTFQSIAQQIRVASDIMLDETNGDPTRTCDAISVGIGFKGSAIKLGAVAAPTAPPPNPCP